MSKKRLKVGDRVEFDSHNIYGKPCKLYGVVQVYSYPHFHPDGYVEVVSNSGEMLLYGNAGSVRKLKS